MRTTLELPAGLLEEARAAGGFTSNAETVEFALWELVRRRRADALKALFGHVNLDIDIPRSRRRPQLTQGIEHG